MKTSLSFDDIGYDKHEKTSFVSSSLVETIFM